MPRTPVLAASFAALGVLLATGSAAADTASPPSQCGATQAAASPQEWEGSAQNWTGSAREGATPLAVKVSPEQ
jgi:hypothetical protein